MLLVEVLKTVIKDSVMSAEMQEAVDTIQFVLGRIIVLINAHLKHFLMFRETEGF